MSKHSRVKYFEAWRGIAILMVIAIHTYNNTDVSAGLAIRQLFNCAVPVFLPYQDSFCIRRRSIAKMMLLLSGGNRFPRFTYLPSYGRFPCFSWVSQTASHGAIWHYYCSHAALASTILSQ